MALLLAEIGDDDIRVKRLVGDQCFEDHLFDEWFDEWPNADDVEALSWQQHETHESAGRIGEGQDFWCSCQP
ncbi:hypothetical protein [Bradyrhizobium iriomotense]|uniref:Uncharacterized protein n=1 Tax=Bradyrhizobium iriomotense TaxID=441950 RepID=A0ABQ6B9B2_9BRAD|nr:hypothetical protein [Bradyrhizobium iriomotense]GLR90019.1 hypothetical protein GCM10007857_67330 [Bradyrhizobium iriomotense]